MLLHTKKFSLILKNNQLWVGVTNYNVGMHFYLPDNYEDYKLIDENGKKIGRVSTSCWWTNIENKRRNEPIDLYKRYSFEDYPKYDNYLGFNVTKVTDIPMDDFIDIEIPDEEYEEWKKVYGDDLVILE